MKLNRKWFLVIALVMSLAMATAGTLAYLTDRDTVVNTFTMGNVDIEVDEDFTQNAPIKPGQEVNKDAQITNKGSKPAWVWMTVSVPEGLKDYVTMNWANGFTPTSDSPVVENGQAVWTVLVDDKLAANTSTDYILDSVTLSPLVDYQNGEYIVVTNENGEVKTAKLEGIENGEMKVTVNGYAVQADGFDDVKAAYKAYNKQWGLSNTWDGTADTSWYNDTDTEFVITTPEQLAGFANLVDGGNTFAGKTVKLGKDIDLYAEDANGARLSFDPIGYGYNTVFKGTFDGQDHTIKNLYQNGWELGYDYSTEGGGLFASVVDASFKNLTIDKANIVMECIDMGILAGYSYGNSTYENILVKNSSIANYQRYTGGVVGEVNGTQTFKNVDVVDTVVSSLWGDFDCSLGGIIGGKWGDATVTMENCDVACELNAYNDVTSAYQWYAYRRAGMLIGNSEETQTSEGRTSATASYLTAKNCTVTYGDWVNYTYCKFAGTDFPYVRVQGSTIGQSAAYSNPRYGVATDANGNKVVDDSHVHHDGEDHNKLLTFDQLYGGGQGVYGTPAHAGVTVNYNN